MPSLGLNIPRGISLRQQVSDSIREAILAGKLRPGQRLIERELCEELRISRTILREALHHLEAEGLIVNIPRKGRAVTDIPETEAKELYEVREALDALVGEGFVRNATDAQIERLRAHLDRLNSSDIEDDEFTSIMLEGCGNKVAAEILKHLNNRITILRRLSAHGARSDARIAERQALVAAIEARDVKLARRLAPQHSTHE